MRKKKRPQPGLQPTHQSQTSAKQSPPQHTRCRREAGTLRPSETTTILSNSVFIYILVCVYMHENMYKFVSLNLPMRGGRKRHPLPQANKLRRIIPISHSINISPFCSIHSEEPAATIITRLFHLRMWGRHRRKRGRREREMKGRKHMRK